MSKKTIALATIAVFLLASAHSANAKWKLDNRGQLLRQETPGASGRGVGRRPVSGTPTPTPTPFDAGTIITVQSSNDKLKIEAEDTAVDNQLQDESETDEVEIEDSEDKDVTKIRSSDNAATVIRNKIAAQTHFPIMVNTETNELIITTPAGQRVVTVLPDKAVQNMLAANVLDEIAGKGGIRWKEYQTSLPTPSPETTISPSLEVSPAASPSISPSPSETPSPSPSQTPTPTPETTTESSEATITLTTDEDGTLVYEIQGAKEERLFGIFQKVTLKRTVVVSAETGELIRINQNLPTRLLSIISF